jgi:hypothetical protein
MKGEFASEEDYLKYQINMNRWEEGRHKPNKDGLYQSFKWFKSAAKGLEGSSWCSPGRLYWILTIITWVVMIWILSSLK